MKAINKLIAAAIIVIGAAANSNAQATTDAIANATVITPITISKDVDMNFGNIAVSSLTAGTVMLSPAGIRSSTGGVTLPATAGTVAAASFTVTGQGNYTYAITLPLTALTISNAANTMTVSSFTSTPATTGALTAGTQTLQVGATLNVAAAQAPGLYSSTIPFNVTVNYN